MFAFLESSKGVSFQKYYHMIGVLQCYGEALQWSGNTVYTVH